LRSGERRELKWLAARRILALMGRLPPNRGNRKRKYRWKKAVHRERNLVKRFFNKLKQFRHIATRYDELDANFFAFIQLAAIRIVLRSIEPTAQSFHPSAASVRQR
jgi:transposase